MTGNYPALLVTVPLLAAFVIYGCSWLHKRSCLFMALLGLTIPFAISVALLKKVLINGHISYHLGGWDPPWGIAYELDPINAIVLVAVTTVALVNLIATSKEIETRFSDRRGAFYALYLLFVVGLLGIVATGDLFNLYVLLEIASITGYSLIAMGDPARAPLSSLNYVFMGTIGACFYLLGVGYIYIMTGSLNMADVHVLLPPLYHSSAIVVAFIFCLVGVMIKMGFFPLHSWLPNAYTYVPSPAASLIAPLMTKVMAYVMIRLMISVFSPKFVFSSIAASNAVVWLACLAIVMGALMALAQRDVRRMLTYIIVSEIGYIVGGAWIGNATAMSGAVLHIINDVLMTFCVFLSLGAIARSTKGYQIENFSGLFKKIPVTMATFVVSGLSIIGIPPTCGFFSKWYLILGAIEGGHYGFIVVLLLSSLINIILFFRIFEEAFFVYPKINAVHTEGEASIAIAETPFVTLIPLVLTAILLIFTGIYSGSLIALIIKPVVSAGLL